VDAEETPIEPDAAGHEPITVVVHRRVRAGRQTEYEDAMRRFVQFALSSPGFRGLSVLRPPAGGRDYTVVDRFADAAARREFRASPLYGEWMQRLAELTEGDPLIEELSGLEGWFAGAAPAALRAPPKARLAVATFCGVFPTVTTLNLLLGPTLKQWPFLLASAAFNACVVVALTWLVMPLVTRLLRRWLFPARD
jgi:antibiotic biosynthesis monooxygenase (ABM) superfamily enzyme